MLLGAEPSHFILSRVCWFPFVTQPDGRSVQGALWDWGSGSSAGDFSLLKTRPGLGRMPGWGISNSRSPGMLEERLLGVEEAAQGGGSGKPKTQCAWFV